MRAALAFTAIVLPVLVACAQAPTATTAIADTAAPAQVVEQHEELLATVEDVDMESRILTLRRPDGSVEKIHAPAEVENLPQVRIGDQVMVTYAASLKAVKAENSDAPTSVADNSVVKAPKGDMPGVAAVSSSTTTVTVEHYDPETHTLSFTGPNGILRMGQLRRSQMQDLASTLKKGDQVQVTYSEAAALTVRRPK
jgi:Cu/Ag efflux protein CusF